MLDLVNHDGDKFVAISDITESSDKQLLQAYTNLFLTNLGSIQVDPEIGSSFVLGSINSSVFRPRAEIINEDTVRTMIAEGYDILGAFITSFEFEDDEVTMAIRLNTPQNQLTFNVTI